MLAPPPRFRESLRPQIQTDQIPFVIPQEQPPGVERRLRPAAGLEHAGAGEGTEAVGRGFADDQLALFRGDDELPISKDERAALHTFLLPFPIARRGVEADEIAATGVAVDPKYV